MGEKVQQQLKELGSKLDSPPSTKDALIKLLKQGATCLSELDQTPPKPVLESMRPFLNAIVKPELLKHQDREVKLLVATCICEITRITAPEAPYSDDILKDIFRLIVSTFSGLSDTSGPHFGRRVVILETLARYRSCVVMLDLECDDLVNEMFSTFFAVARDEHSESVFTSMQTIMVVLLEESEDVREDLLLILLSVLGRNRKDVTKAARRLAMNVIEHCAGKLEPSIKQFLISSMSGDSKSLKFHIDYHEVIYDIYRSAPQILSGVVPYMTGELLTDQLDVRLKAVKLVGDLFAMPGSNIPESFQPIFCEFLKRLTDRVVEVRMSVLEHVKICLLSNPSRAESSQIIAALSDRLLDYDENVRKQVVTVICDVACRALTSIPVDTIKLVAERLRDKSLLVKNYTMERLAEIYRIYCLNCSKGLTRSDEYDWIPGKILRCFYDKDFRSDTVESILSLSLFPTEFSTKDKVNNWIKVFSEYDKVEIKALEKILELKQRLQQEMQRYLSLRQMNQESDASELQKKVMFSFRVMSRCFMDPARTEENFHILDQLKDANVWKILSSLLDPSTTSLQVTSSRDDLLRILGEKHRLYEFLGTLSVKCSYLLFNKEHVKEILLETELQKSAGNTQLILSCMNILVILARYSPLLLSGIEEDLIHLLEDDNEIIKEGVLHVLAKAGGAIREQLGVSSRSLDLILERICLEGSRRQAKYAVHALASITKDDGLMSLSVLYKKLVDMLEEKSHLPAVLQCLGCIAQTAMPVFETRESEIEGFIKKNILEQGHISEDNEKVSWDDRSDLCSLKIFGIKTLVKSYIPIKDAHLRLGIDDLIGILKNILSFGDISSDIESSSIDKAHLRLGAAKAVLRLSKHWDHKIPIDVFYLTLRTSEPNFPQVKTLFLNKVYQYIKDRVLDPKYACAFLLDLGSQQLNFEENKNNLSEIIQMCQQAKARQLSTQSDANTPALYPEFILPYLVHALAHHPLFPNIDECKDVKAYELIYRQLYFFLSMLVHGDDDGKSEVNISKDNESISAIVSVFQSIKQSEDALDAAKSKNSYAVCDLGLFVVKRLAPNEDELLDLSASLSLPPMLYKPLERKEGDVLISEGKTWLADENVLAHFESLKLEANGIHQVSSEIAEDDIMNDSETDGNDLPLGKLMKRLKAKGGKGRKEVRDEVSLAGAKNESDVDILKMVREINSDDMEVYSKFESSNGLENNSKGDDRAQKTKRVENESAIVPVPKRRRSSSAQEHKLSPQKLLSKFSRRSIKNEKQDDASSYESIERDDDGLSGSEDRSFQEDVNKLEEPDLLASHIKRNPSLSMKHKRKQSEMDHETPEVKATGESFAKKPKRIAEMSIGHAISDSKSGSFKKQKRKSVAGLAKCTLKGGGSPIMDLIGCRIKVWWPMDKQFYEGVVKSFDTQKMKHVVLYDDGDVEVLRLEKERWELVDNGRKSTKQSNSSKSPRSKEIMSGQKKKSSGGSRQNKKMTEISPLSQAKGKRTPRKNLKRGEKWVSKSKGFTESRVRRSIEHSEHAGKSIVNDSDSGDEQNERVEKSSSDEEKYSDDERSISGGKEGEGAENVSSDVEEPKDDEQPSENKNEDVDYTHQDFYGSDTEAVSSSEEKPNLDVAKEGFEEVDESDRVYSPGSQGDVNSVDEDDVDERKRTPTSDCEAAELSDDEPLSMWRRRVGKSK